MNESYRVNRFNKLVNDESFKARKAAGLAGDIGVVMYTGNIEGGTVDYSNDKHSLYMGYKRIEEAKFRIAMKEMKFY